MLTEITFDIPANLFINPALLTAGSIAVVDRFVDRTQVNFNATVASWVTEVKFAKDKAKKKGSVVEGSCGTDNRIYVFVNDGTDEHEVGSRGQLMSFFPSYRPKTAPGVIKSVAGGSSGTRQVAQGPWVVSGIEPRAFDAAIEAKLAPQFYKDMDRMLDNLIKGKPI